MGAVDGTECAGKGDWGEQAREDIAVKPVVGVDTAPGLVGLSAKAGEPVCFNRLAAALALALARMSSLYFSTLQARRTSRRTRASIRTVSCARCRHGSSCPTISPRPTASWKMVSIFFSSSRRWAPARISRTCIRMVARIWSRSTTWRMASSIHCCHAATSGGRSSTGSSSSSSSSSSEDDDSAAGPVQCSQGRMVPNSMPPSSGGSWNPCRRSSNSGGGPSSPVRSMGGNCTRRSGKQQLKRVSRIFTYSNMSSVSDQTSANSKMASRKRPSSSTV
mmetsp:Transcript_16414/g.29134  ORF Transcript_16414/g.29134 Transcript_16414/m.29134 type:complete len:277 (-) Transcript_16414:1014-1844(-)